MLYAGGSFFLACADFEKRFVESLSAYTFLFVWQWRTVGVQSFHSSGQDQSTVAQRAKTTDDKRKFIVFKVVSLSLLRQLGDCF